jgi:tetratricopeptide (TPR) repeat protein
MDQQIIAGLAAVKEKKWAEARADFEKARKIQEKEKLPSEFLFTKIKLADEDEKEPSDPTEQQITAWRHAMGTRQAILAFIAFSSQLEGNAAASKNFDAVYDLQSVLWGMSWKAFNPPIHKLFHETAPPEKTENYARYLFNAGRLLWSSDDNTQAVKYFEQAQQILPKDKEIAATLTGYYLVIDRDAAKAKKQAELSLSVDPKQGRVLIDLATAEWTLGEVDAAAKHAREASVLLPDLPGPHGTLAFAALEKGDNALALKEAETGDKLSEGHVFYRSILAAALKANGKDKEAAKALATATDPVTADIEQLKKWFFRGKPLEYIEAILKK